MAKNRKQVDSRASLSNREAASGSSGRRSSLVLLAVFPLYLALYILWSLSGCKSVYDRSVLAVADTLLPWIQHFPVVETVAKLELNQDFLVVLAFTIVMLLHPKPLSTRWRPFLILFIIIYAIQVTTVLLHTLLVSAQDMRQLHGMQLLLPWEFLVVNYLKFVLYDFGLQLGAFALLGLGLWWQTERWRAGFALGASHSSRSSLKWRFGTMAAAVLLMLTGHTVWDYGRERAEGHARTHVRVGQILYRTGHLARAEEHYRKAMANGHATQAEIREFARVLRAHGRHREAALLLADADSL